MFERKYRFKRVKPAWHHQNRFKGKLVLFLRFSLKSNFWKSHAAITHINTRTHTAADTMPCAAGRRCAVPDDTPGPPRFTNHQCRGVCGQYLHGNCGVVDPRGTSEIHRICHTCATSRESDTSGAGTAGAQSETRDSSGAAAPPPPPYGGVAEHFCELVTGGYCREVRHVPSVLPPPQG